MANSHFRKKIRFKNNSRTKILGDITCTGRGHLFHPGTD